MKKTKLPRERKHDDALHAAMLSGSIGPQSDNPFVGIDADKSRKNRCTRNKMKKFFHQAARKITETGDAFLKVELLDPDKVAAKEEFDPKKLGCDMYKQTCPLGETVDLNDPETYSGYRYKNWNTRQLIDEIYRQVGYVKLYIEQFNPGWDKEQVEHINQMLFWYGRERKGLYDDRPESRHWLRKWLFRFEDETENMC